MLAELGEVRLVRCPRTDGEGRRCGGMLPAHPEGTCLVCARPREAPRAPTLAELRAMVRAGHGAGTHLVEGGYL